MRKILYFYLVLNLFITGCFFTIETKRDPSKKGFLMAERMVRSARYHDALLLHRVNANFFRGLPYAEKSAKRVIELDDVLKKSLEGRPTVEIIKNKIISKNSQKFIILDVVNNTDRKISQLTFRIRLFDSNGMILRQKITRKRYMLKESTKILGSWDIIQYIYPLEEYPEAMKSKVKIDNGFYMNGEKILFK